MILLSSMLARQRCGLTGTQKPWVCKLKAYLGPETGNRDRVSYFLEKNNVRIVLTSAVKPSTYDVASFVEKHGDGVKRWSVRVKDVGKSFETSLQNGGIPVRYPKKSEDENGFIEEAAIKLYDDAEIVFINEKIIKDYSNPDMVNLSRILRSQMKIPV